MLSQKLILIYADSHLLMTKKTNTT